MAKKFWAINATGDYRPSSNPLVPFKANVGTTSATGVSSSIISGINALGGTAAIFELDVVVASATATTITFGTTYTGSLTGSNNLNYYNKTKPCASLDAPISGIIGNASSPLAFVITDINNNSISFGTGTLKQGEVYPIEVGVVTTVTTNQYIGFSES